MGRPKKLVSARKSVALNVKGDQAWKNWFGQSAKLRKLTVADLLDEMAVDYAKKYGLAEPPPRLPD